VVETLTFHPRATSAPNGGSTTIPRASATDPHRPASPVPASIPSDQAYYWSVPWQRDVREAMEAYDAGDVEVFDSDDPNDVVRWFLADDD
jgi:hypothetical protein